MDELKQKLLDAAVKLMSGEDYLNFIQIISNPDYENNPEFTELLNKYNMEEDNVMEDARLNHLYKQVKEGKTVEEARKITLEHVKPLSLLNMHSVVLEAEKYSAFVETDETNIDQIVEWVDRNKIPFTFRDSSTLLVDCNESNQYELNSFISKLLSEGKKSKKADNAPRNPYASLIAKKQLSGHGSHKQVKKDAHSLDRDAKHKSKIDEDLAVGDTVVYNGEKFEVKINKGPKETIGLDIDGKTKMVEKDKTKKVNEGVLGMTSLDTLNRLRQLAGIRTNVQLSEDEISAVDDISLDAPEDDFEVDINDDLGDDEDFSFDTSLDDDSLGSQQDDFSMSAGPELGMDSNIGLGLDSNLGLGGDLSQGSVSEAFTEIQSHLTDIQTKLGDAKLSEYKSIISRLEDLIVQVKALGKSYLGENERKKKQ